MVGVLGRYMIQKMYLSIIRLSLHFLLSDSFFAKKKACYNSSNKFPDNLYLADIDGDNNQEFVQLGENKVFT